MTDERQTPTGDAADAAPAAPAAPAARGAEMERREMDVAAPLPIEPAPGAPPGATMNSGGVPDAGADPAAAWSPGASVSAASERGSEVDDRASEAGERGGGPPGGQERRTQPRPAR
ncbi:MAG TPA: hypothetical protein VFS08_15720 [Gemmatimonadaceae bacterium]|nr:hypothetical protein [Gemmatimonadaceae bacterium]